MAPVALTLEESLSPAREEVLMLSRLVDRVVVSVIAGDGVAGRVADYVIGRIPGWMLDELVDRTPARIAKRVAADLPRCNTACNWTLFAHLDEGTRPEEAE
ncbi:hypothetical protein [Nocardioides sp. L-11A]|uniref:hypothetical protein n=1 Tax=Nocardioides sp. L-11A TaxID=3043848 RepID=UPI00249C716E|nr:hypothetical protein QJ852_17000 [Nocardioides sp. L-11A]